VLVALGNGGRGAGELDPDVTADGRALVHLDGQHVILDEKQEESFAPNFPGSVARDRCYDFKNIFAEKFGEKSIFGSNQS
jgi:hypothetical protein